MHLSHTQIQASLYATTVEAYAQLPTSSSKPPDGLEAQACHVSCVRHLAFPLFFLYIILRRSISFQSGVPPCTSIELEFFFDASHLGTAVASVHTRTHAPPYTRTHHTHHTCTTRPTTTQIRRPRPSRDHRNLQGSVGDGCVTVPLWLHA